eukprot:CAMPEP_0178483286 /NCGR_PEP_ID=MMETSP0696-20121128/7156_1 /TAXON_ID=265572 /ORGANISM="Extubocellulus spinifer, Strain CCMP396" /LENGTH=589 /DNA_ID=CAMNT_0020110799 /DNA_START=633 /DNA_END=2402 /DNA_ORIENTATION=-
MSQQLHLVPSPFGHGILPVDNAAANGVDRRENSNLISISSLDRSLWRGKIWSTITFNVKTDKYFLDQLEGKNDGDEDEKKKKKKKKAAGDDSYYILRPSVVNCRTGATYRNGDDGKVSFRFEKNVDKSTDGSLARVTKDSNNSIKAKFHQDLFQNGDSFILDIEAVRKGDSQVIFGRSPIMSVTNLALSIEQDFTGNPYVMQIDSSDDFAWYSKCGGDKSGLSVIFHLRDEKGRIVNPSMAMPLRTELVYADGSPTPIMPLAPLKQRRSSKMSKISLYHPLVPDPCLEPSADSKSFSFRIEEVSFHHPGKRGFKLKVSPAHPTQHFVHPGFLEENIIVLSKPKHDANKTKKKRGGRVSITGISGTTLTTRDDGEIGARPTKIRKVSNTADHTEGGPHVSLPLDIFVDNLRPDGKCLSCGKKVSAGSFLDEKSHKKSCQFRSGFLPSITLTMNPVVKIDSEYGGEPDDFTSEAAVAARNIPPVMHMETVASSDPPALPFSGAGTFPVPSLVGNHGFFGVFGTVTSPRNAFANPAYLNAPFTEDRNPFEAAAAASTRIGDEERTGTQSSLGPFALSASAASNAATGSVVRM